jgi:hypothetical protein
MISELTKLADKIKDADQALDLVAHVLGFAYLAGNSTNGKEKSAELEAFLQGNPTPSEFMERMRSVSIELDLKKP